LDELFQDLEDAVEFNQDQILTQDTITSLQAYANAGLQDIDYDSYINQTRMSISDLNVSGTLTTLESVRDAFDAAGQVSNKLLPFHVTTMFAWLNTSP